ncbi:GNAT family N-acetyltransferase [bacterium]|nr:GNAT family N-acetyltransferase [bacterium]
MWLHFFSTPTLHTKFHDSLREHAYAVRRRVFQIEQGIPAIHDRDLHDESAYHFVVYALALDSTEFVPIAAARAVAYEEGFKIGRVCVDPDQRGALHIGTQLMEYVIAQLQEHFPDRKIFLYAQADDARSQNVVGFYERLGFVTTDDEPLISAGILHRKMELV